MNNTEENILAINHNPKYTLFDKVVYLTYKAKGYITGVFFHGGEFTYSIKFNESLAGGNYPADMSGVSEKNLVLELDYYIIENIGIAASNPKYQKEDSIKWYDPSLRNWFYGSVQSSFYYIDIWLYSISIDGDSIIRTEAQITINN
jgi:hypothetical protein